jgi:hypothetical protein
VAPRETRKVEEKGKRLRVGQRGKGWAGVGEASRRGCPKVRCPSDSAREVKQGRRGSRALALSPWSFPKEKSLLLRQAR